MWKVHIEKNHCINKYYKCRLNEKGIYTLPKVQLTVFVLDET